jgi:hypothetical protein
MITDWTKVVTDPLGLAGFALSLVFTSLSRLQRVRQGTVGRWFAPVAYLLAAGCIVGGLFLAYQHESIKSNIPDPRTTTVSAPHDQGDRPQTPVTSAPGTISGSVKQESRGSQSPNITSAGGVSVQYGSSNDQASAKPNSKK